LERLEQVIVTMTRALDLMTEFDKSFHEARILTDLRPLFGEPSDIQGAVIVHTLRVEYHERGSVKSFFVTLGSDELRELEAVVDRAISKHDALRTFAEGANLKLYDVIRDDQG